MYPAKPGTRFNWDYYLGSHLAQSRKLLIPLGLVRTEVDRGIGGFPLGSSPPYHAVGHLFFRTMSEMENALAATAAEFIAAIPFLCCAGATYLLGRVPEARRAHQGRHAEESRVASELSV